MARRGNQHEFGTSKETTRLLTEGMVHARESEEVALATGDALRDQRGALESVRENVDNMKGVSLSAAESIRQLDLKTSRRKLCLWAVVIILFIANVSVLIAMWKHGGKIIGPTGGASREGVAGASTTESHHGVADEGSHATFM